MELIPKKKILITSILVFVVLAIILNLSLGLQESESPANFSPEDQPDNVGEEVEILRDLEGQEISSPKILGLNLLLLGVISFIAIFSWKLYHIVLNSDELRLFTNTQLKLAGFDPALSWVGRSVAIGRDAKLLVEIDNSLEFTMIFSPERTTTEISPELFGISQSRGKYQIKCDTNQLQLALQSFQRFIADYRNSIEN